MFYMFADSPIYAGFLSTGDKVVPEFERAYPCATEAGAKAIAEVFLSRNPQYEAVKILKVTAVDQVHRDDEPAR